jgi:hypothetical protein
LLKYPSINCDPSKCATSWLWSETSTTGICLRSIHLSLNIMYFIQPHLVLCKQTGSGQTRSGHGLAWSTVYGLSRSIREISRRAKFRKIQSVPPLALGGWSPTGWDGSGTVRFFFTNWENRKKLNIKIWFKKHSINIQDFYTL